MPIRINLLAEQQLAEDLRRRDPVKRGYWIAGFVVALVLFWSLVLQMRIWAMSSESARLQEERKTAETKAKPVTLNYTNYLAVQENLNALTQLATNRVLWGPLLDAVQFALVDNLEVAYYRARYDYITVDPGEPENLKKKTPGRPPKIREKIVLTIGGRCYAPDEQPIYQFKSRLLALPAMRSIFTNETSVTPENDTRMTDTGNNRTFTPFRLICNFPENTR